MIILLNLVVDLKIIRNISEHPNASIDEMDSVSGKNEDIYCIITMLLKNIN